MFCMTSAYDQSLKKPREKSALYPAVTLDDCLDFIQKIDSIGGETVPYASVIALMGLKNPTTRSFLSRISASKQFGLIITGNSMIQLTDTGRRILTDAHTEKSHSLLVDAFVNPPLYQKLVERFLNRALPPKNQLASILVNEYRIIRQVKDLAAECFLKSAESLGLIVDGVLSIGGLETSYGVSQAVATEMAENCASKEQLWQGGNATGYYFEIPTLSKNAAKIFIPASITEKDLDYITLYIQNMLPAFLDNLRGEITGKKRE